MLEREKELTHRNSVKLSGNMKPDETVSQSLLDKPLHELTEEDISQLTREDCRKFLRDKGMRRPSWNKSQAIEQVISLKNLLEPRPESDANGAGSRRNFHLFRPDNITQKENIAELPISAPQIENVADRKKDSSKSDILGDVSCSVPEPVRDTATTTSNRSMNSTNELVGQMTIFYCGKMNVYEGVPADKAIEIMQLAASHINVPQDSLPAGTAAVHSFACQLQDPSIKSGLLSPSAVSPSIHNEGLVSRKASVQRYLEKRKGRGIFKNKQKIGSSSSLEMYLNYQLRDQNQNEQSSQSMAYSPPYPRPPHTPTRRSSVENKAKNIVFSIDLNENGLQEARLMGMEAGVSEFSHL